MYFEEESFIVAVVVGIVAVAIVGVVVVVVGYYERLQYSPCTHLVIL